MTLTSRRYFDREGQPLSLMEWAVKLEDDAYARVAFDQVGDVRISTRWVGLPPVLSTDDEAPLVYETVVWRGADDAREYLDGPGRCATLAEAQAQHASEVEQWKRVAT